MRDVDRPAGGNERPDVLGELAGFRVLATCDFFSPQSSGGVERVVLQVLRKLVGWGADVLVVTALPRGLRPYEPSAGLAVKTVAFVDLAPVVGIQVGVAPRAVGAVRSAIREFSPDVVMASGLFFQSSLASAIASAFVRVPLVTASHNSGPRHLRQPTRLLMSAYEATLGRFILHRSSRVIAVSAGAAAHLRELGVRADQIDVIPNGVDINLFRPGPEVDRHPPVIVFVGRLISNKAPQVLIEALIRVHDQGIGFEAVFVGDGPLREGLAERARAAGVAASFRSHVSDVAGVLRDADILVNPSFSEGMPLSVLEGMAAGLCIVASDVRGNSDLVAGGKTGFLVPAGDPAELARVLATLLTDPHERRRLGRAARRVAEGYSWEVCAERTAATLLRAAAERRS